MAMDILSYDKYILAFSGGKDSISTFLHLLELGVPVDKIELWHHEVDGREGEAFMDWKCTTSYCRAFAKEFNVPIYFSWKEGGFEREMLRKDSLAAPTKFENEFHEIITVGGVRGKLSTRRKFPQVSGDLSVRWCSAYLKIDICATAIRNQRRFDGLNVLVISGERAEESVQRAKYEYSEPDRADNRNGKASRLVDRCRLILDKTEAWVWDIIARWRVRVHPCYYMGWSRCSCKWCIFGNDDQMASASRCSIDKGSKIIKYENEFGVTIKRNKSVAEQISNGIPYSSITPELIDLANSDNYNLPIIMVTEEWFLPAGAFGESCGPN